MKLGIFHNSTKRAPSFGSTNTNCQIGLIKCFFILIRLMILLLLGSEISAVLAQGYTQTIATGGLNQFDLGQFCGEYPDLDEAPLPKSSFGYSAFREGFEADFSYLSSQYYAEKGPDGFPHGCRFKRYIYHLADGRGFRREEIDEKRFKETEALLQAYVHRYRQLNPRKSLGSPTGFKVDSVGGCLFEIYWYGIRDQEYALLSLSNVGIVEFVEPDSQIETGSQSTSCRAWGGRRLTNSSITSTKDLAVMPLKDNLLFMEWRAYQRGFIFKPDTDFQCVKSNDAFLLHILINRKLFDAEVRPALNALLQKGGAQLSRGASDAGAGALAFAESVFLNAQFANKIVSIAKTKGCS